jgi:hypothetical protein
MAQKRSKRAARRSPSRAGGPDVAEAGHLLSANPPHRRLNVFSLDPAVDAKLEHALISRSVLAVPWERVQPGPVGEYLEVVDVDPSSGCVYDPVDLNDHDLLAQDGLSPSTGNPQFHQQMVYAVAMKTIANFEQVLGRKLLWAERQEDEDGARVKKEENRYVQRLRIYPHALREQNAYYSPTKTALLFGYFNAPTTDPRDELPGGLVFSCLSHDIVAHEMTHAILDGMHRRMLEVSNLDMIAFHEAFADIVAIFQHFTLPGLLLDQIQRTRGDLESNNLLAQLASQFARATGRGDALRNALGTFDAHGRRQRPDPALVGRTFESHERGAILVAAVFDAFVRMYENRVADLRRIATGGTGVLPVGDIHPDLARRFAEEAVRLSQRVLNMCIRAIDYLPPVDVTFGDFLRALVTADADFFPDDPRRYRLAFIESFRDRGIYPLDIRALAEDALRWSPLASEEWKRIDSVLPPAAVLQTMATAYDSTRMTAALSTSGRRTIRRALNGGHFDAAAAGFLKAAWPSGSRRVQEPSADNAAVELGARYPRYRIERTFATFLHEWIDAKAKAGALDDQRLSWHLGIDLRPTGEGKRPPIEVHAVRPTIRLRADGRSSVELLIVLAQKKRAPLLEDPSDPKSVMKGPDGEELSFEFRGGSTLIVNPDAPEIRYSVAKNIASTRRRVRHMAFLRDQIARQGTAAIVRFKLIEKTRGAEREFTGSRRYKELQKLEPFAVAHTGSNDAGTY